MAYDLGRVDKFMGVFQKVHPYTTFAHINVLKILK